MVFAERCLKTTESNSGTEKSDGSNYVLTVEGEYEALIGGLADADYEELISTGSTGSNSGE